MKASFEKYTLRFKRPGGTSRGVLHEKDTYFLHLENLGSKGIGECNLFKGLSYDDSSNYEDVLTQVCIDLNAGKPFYWENYRNFPSIQFGVEQALISLQSHPNDILFPSEFTKGKQGILINGLIWMGSLDFMKTQITEKLSQGFQCLKLKIGTDWEGEYQILKHLRNEFSIRELEIRVDANGAFSFHQAKEVLHRLAELNIHSIEQPIKAGNWEEMAKLCETTPTPIALDEELIGVIDMAEKENCLQQIQPQYIILKPALIGGYHGSEEWISLANKNGIGWWITSALESNIGLNAIAQWTYTLNNAMPQGLGTGGLFTNNIPSRLQIKGEKLWFNPILQN